MHKIGVIGDRDSVLGFKSLGFSVFYAEKAQEAADALQKAASEGYSVIYITENIAQQIPEYIENYKSNMLPAIIPIPGISGIIGIGQMGVKKSVEKAVGADILDTFNQE